MKRELGFGRCGLACCLCAKDGCTGCASESCPDVGWCENRRCSLEKGIAGCYACGERCEKGLLSKVKPQGFRLYIERFGAEALLDRLAENERAGIAYHREGVSGDYDAFETPEALVEFLLTGERA